MISYVFICLTFYGFLSYGASADDSQCTSLLLKNITDETQSSIVVMLLNSAKSVLEDAKKYTSIKSKSSALINDSQCTSLLLKQITDETEASIVITLLNNAENLLDDARKYASMRTNCPVVDAVCEKRMDCPKVVCDKPMDCPKVVCDKPIDLSHLAQAMDCAEVMEKNPSANSGVYKIWPRRINGSIEVYCDMEDDGGGWTVLQRRGDFNNDKDYFYKDWQSYKKGFGDLEKEFWLGNDNIFALTNQRSNSLKFSLTDWENITTYATYYEFRIGNEAKKYQLHVRGYSGTAGDSFFFLNGAEFTTKDQDNEPYPGNCAVRQKGAWWYINCGSSINGLYLKGAYESFGDGVTWNSFRGLKYSLKDTVMKIRPKDFRKNPDKVAGL